MNKKILQAEIEVISSMILYGF